MSFAEAVAAAMLGLAEFLNLSAFQLGALIIVSTVVVPAVILLAHDVGILFPKSKRTKK